MGERVCIQEFRPVPVDGDVLEPGEFVCHEGMIVDKAGKVRRSCPTCNRGPT